MSWLGLADTRSGINRAHASRIAFVHLLPLLLWSTIIVGGTFEPYTPPAVRTVRCNADPSSGRPPL